MSKARSRPLADLSRCAVHTQTNKPWALKQCVEAYSRAGIGGISVWRHTIDPEAGGVSPEEAGRMLRDSPLRVPALVRGGFFVTPDDTSFRSAIDENRRCIDEANAIKAEMVVLVVGAMKGVPLDEARKQVADGIAACVEHASANRVKLAIEPLHPMYAADKSCINRMTEAREVCERIGSEWVGIAVDVYHLWWDPDLEKEIKLAGENATLFGFHVCDWRVPTRDLLTDRGVMGEGVIDIPRIRRWVEDAGFEGFNEVEIFSEDYWKMDQGAYLNKIIEAYREHV